MSDYIKRNDAINRLQEIANDYECAGDKDAFYVANYCLHHIMELLPATDVVERKSEKLKPCPFCGGGAHFEQTGCRTIDNHSVSLQFEIRCKKCGATAPNAYGYIAINLLSNGEFNAWHDDKKSAIAAWNRRVEEE